MLEPNFTSEFVHENLCVFVEGLVNVSDHFLNDVEFLQRFSFLLFLSEFVAVKIDYSLFIFSCFLFLLLLTRLAFRPFLICLLSQITQVFLSNFDFENQLRKFVFVEKRLVKVGPKIVNLRFIFLTVFFVLSFINNDVAEFLRDLTHFSKHFLKSHVWLQFVGLRFGWPSNQLQKCQLFLLFFFASLWVQTESGRPRFR